MMMTVVDFHDGYMARSILINQWEGEAPTAILVWPWLREQPGVQGIDRKPYDDA